MLCGLHNQISSSAHSSVVQGHVEFLRLLEGQQWAKAHRSWAPTVTKRGGCVLRSPWVTKGVTFSSLFTLKPLNFLLKPWLIFAYSWFVILLLSYSPCFTLTHLCLLFTSSSYFLLTHLVSHWLITADSLLHLVLYKPEVPTLYSLS